MTQLILFSGVALSIAVAYSFSASARGRLAVMPARIPRHQQKFFRR